jgi:hypothetical protein
VTNGRILISGNIRQKKPLNIAVMRNKDHYISHAFCSKHYEKNIFAEGTELIFYNEIGF